MGGDINRIAKAVVERAAGLTLYARQWLDVASAEDVVQEALAALLSQTAQPEDPIAWMYRAVRNAAIDQARASTRRRKREQAVAGLRQEWFESEPDSAIDARAAEETLERLPQRDREIVVLRIWGGMRLTQIAQIMQLSVSHIHGRYAAALAQMRIELEKPCKAKTTK